LLRTFRIGKLGAFPNPAVTTNRRDSPSILPAIPPVFDRKPRVSGLANTFQGVIMQRRNFLMWVSRILGTAVAALVTIPGAQYVWNTLRPQATAPNSKRRVVRWVDLRPGEPMQFSIYGERRDAWHVEPQQVIGRVWLVRSSTDQGDGKVVAFSNICPHMGCQVQRGNKDSAFVCPCHQAAFQLDGTSKKAGSERSHAPRGLDQLPCEVVQDEAGERWVEVEYQKFESSLTEKVLKS